MSRNGSGQYNLPAGNPVVTGTTISSTWANNTLNDVASALTGSVAADGQTPMTGQLDMNSNKIKNVADPTLAQDAATKNYSDTTFARKGANSDITSLTGLTTPLSQAQGGTGTTTGYYGFKNRIINGAMVIDQRNAGASVTPTATAYTLDRWALNISQASKLTVRQNLNSITPPAGFRNYLGISTASAVSIGSGDYFFLLQAIEGFNTSDFNFGTANAQTLTLSFWVRSSLTGTFGGSLTNEAFNRAYPFTYTISSADTWEYKTITITGDTTGTWVGATNGAGLILRLGLGVGSTYSGTAGSWSGTGAFSATGATSVVGTNGATFYITGVQLEVGSTATSFDYRPYGTELSLCQRYYATINDFWFRTYTNSGQAIGQTLTLPVKMRASPTLTKVGTWAAANCTQPAVNTNSGNSTQSFTIAATWTATADGYFVATDTTQYITAAAEL